YLRQVTHEGLAQGLLELASREGKPVILRFNNVLASEEGKEPYVLGHAQDVTELLATQRALKNLSLTDDLTGLHNRRGFVTLAEQQIKLERHEGTARGLVLLFADLDGLKRINDTHGHEAGSDAIIEFSRIVKSVLRSSDLVARWGGDEFVILTIGSKAEHVGIMSDRINERLRHFNASSGKPYELACSIGLARVPTKGDKTFEKIIAEADEAMYAEKRRRKETADVSARLILA
ncbi:MAG: GGDEF domain-containing protein, partial [Acidobacteriota bacterium]